MKFWLPVMNEPVEQYPDIARLAEQSGFEGVCLADHVTVPVGFKSIHPSGESPFDEEWLFPDPFSMMAAMAMATTRLRLMSYVYVLPLRDPFTVAKQVSTVSVVSGGRIVLGVGVGWLIEEFEVLGRNTADRGRRTDEMLEVITDFWADGYAEHHGEFFDFPRTAMFPVPPAPVPVWVGGKSRAALRRAVRADGWLGMNYPLEEVYTLLDALAEERRRQGDQRQDFETLVIANAMPSAELYRDLEGRGVTSTVAGPWTPGDPAFADLDVKRVALERFAEQFITPAGAAGPAAQR